MRYQKIIKGKFIERPNRFIAKVELAGEGIVTVHVKNTGRCKELLLPGVTVILEDFRERPEGQNRKTKFDLIAVYKVYDDKRTPLLINMDSQAPNKVVFEWLKKQNYDFIKPEYTFGDSRIDFYMEKGDKKFLLEVKGCTLEKDGIGYFPDAPTERGVKHLKELTKAAVSATTQLHCAVAFVIQMEGVREVRPNKETHPEFATALEEAQKSGVEVLFLSCKVSEDSLEIV